MKRAVVLSVMCALSLFGAAYKIPEQSVRSIALSGAYVAGANDADAAYCNPANMSFMDDGQYFELSFTGAYLPKVKYEGKQVIGSGYPPPEIPANAKSASQKFLIPHLHYVSPKFGNIRFGLSVVTPAGFAKKWNSEPQTWSAREFTLRTAEINPSFSYQIHSNFSVGAGVRVLFTDGVIRFNPPHRTEPTKRVLYDIDGDMQTHLGFNLAASYKLPGLTLAATYRNKIDLKEKGDVTIVDTLANRTIQTQGHTKVPLPATLSLAAAVDVSERARVEVEYERTFWSDYKRLVMTFDGANLYNINKPKNWDDTNTFRLGFTYKNSNKLTTMYGIAYDESPVPEETLGFELPDSDALVLSLGALYKVTQRMTLGVAYLYDHKFQRTVSLGNRNGIDGTFSAGGAHLLNLSFNYRF